MDQFSTEEACREYLSAVRWADGFHCPYCGHAETWKQARGILRCKQCRRDISVTAGTVFEGRHLSLRTWFQALWLVVSQKNGVSALGLAHALGIKREKTGWRLLQRIRGAMIRIGRERLSGLVEVDEILIGGKRRIFEGRSPQGKTLVLVAVEDRGVRGIGRIRMQIIPDASGASLRTAITAMVEPGSIVKTDGWAPYRPEEWGYRHRQVKRQPSDLGDDPTPLVHRVSSLLKRWLLGTHQGRVGKQHLKAYLDEFVFRFNRRKSSSRGKLFYRLMQCMVRVKHD